MNERIKQLAEQASHQNSHGYPVTIPYSKDFAEKFAELIVKECADEAKYHVMNISTYADADFVYEQIKRHFGVE